MYSIRQINEVIGGRFLQEESSGDIAYLVYDSRNITFSNTSLFFALHSAHKDGHAFIIDAYRKGIRHFVVDEIIDVTVLAGASVCLVPDTLRALQAVARYHRSLFKLPVIGITGSNGKTIVKEWLNELLQDDYNIVRSPRSYNSQIGVPLSVWQINETHNLGIFEVGISEKGEMEAVASIIDPGLVILTNIGAAHDAGFPSRKEKLQEKLKLAAHAKTIFYRKETLDALGGEALLPDGIERINWSNKEGALIRVSYAYISDQTLISVSDEGRVIEVPVPFTDDASIENATHCLCMLLHLGYETEVIRERFSRLRAVDMRLQLKHAANQCLLINDSYSADITSLKIALDFLQQQHTGLKRTVILSDFLGSSDDLALYQAIGGLLQQYNIGKAVLVGEQITHYLDKELNGRLEILSFPSVEDFLLEFRSSGFSHEIILIKGARSFHFERIAQAFEEKVHQTVLEVDLNALAHNLKQYQQVLKPHVKVMAMVKAFSYGSGGAEIASVLQFNNVDYLGVAYVDEGIELRRNGIRLPIMVMNADESGFSSLIDYNLQPVLYSKKLLQRFSKYLGSQGLRYYPVHLELETGMNRLGFASSDLDQLIQYLEGDHLLKVESVFSHLAASEDPEQDPFTTQQADLFLTMAQQLKSALPYPFLCHIANSAAIIRHPQLQLDMVRLGIGMYGIESTTHHLQLEPVATLKATIAQLKQVPKGDSVSYNRRGIVKRDSLIATVRIGYADGYWRRFSNGVGKMYIRGGLAPVIGTVCMDMTMIDVTDIPDVAVGDTVEIYGKHLPVQEVAAWAGTIPYELMTGISQRVKRVYYQE